jgi:BirA family transcriptional regulator, biotin operon repressor / biotin---[acetyl-CoA-carboxylase] ligase
MSTRRLIDTERLRESLHGQTRFGLDAIEVFAELESTNRYLLEHPPEHAGALRVCIAEFQSSGRGRRGREWHCPAAAGLCLSASWVFAERPADPTTVTLATGVVARQSIESICNIAVGLKWPNDLVWRRRKLGGILVELATGPDRGCHVVVGVGINVDLPQDLLATVSDWAHGAVDLATAMSGPVPDRTALAASLCSGLGELFVHYERDGFTRYREAWRAADELLNAPITVQRGDRELHGTARGIDDDGALLVSDAHGSVHRVISGDVSVRPA